MLRTMVLTGLLLIMGGGAAAETCLQGNCQDGRGTFQWDDGSKFAGSFVNGTPDGAGIYTDPNGRDFNVTYRDGKPISRPNPAHHHPRPKDSLLQ